MAAVAVAKGVVRASASSASRACSTWASVPLAPPDPILGVKEAFKKDTDSRALNLSVGAYRDDAGKPWVLPSVRKAEEALMAEHLNHEYAPISGVPGFTEQAIKFALGEGHRTMAGVQALSGTGSLRIAGELLNMYRPGAKVLLPTPTWGNHLKIFAQSRVETAQYAYYDPATISLDFAGMVRDIKEAPDGSVVLLHACAHNPTGVDPSREQWQELSEVVKAKGHIPLFDSAYQGFASGDAEADAYSMRLFAEQGHPIILCQSFSKNFGLYGQRVGAVSVAAEDAEEAERLTSQLKAIARAMYSNPPLQGARLVMRVLDNPALEAEWRGDCAAMAARIQGMRTALKDALHEAGSTMNWDHITSQIGMFCYSGMTPEEVQRLKAEHHIYLTSNGRISMAGVTSGNVKYLTECIHEVTTKLRQ